MELFVFGHQARDPTTLPAKAPSIKVLWSSWCDAVILTADPVDQWRVQYMGTSLIPSQADHLNTCQELVSALRGQDAQVNFFGSAMHDGLRGYVVSDLNHRRGGQDSLVLFATDVEIEDGQEEIQRYNISGDATIYDVKLLSTGHVQCSTRTRSTGDEQIIQLQDLAALKRHLLETNGWKPSSTPPTPASVPLATSMPLQWGANATTTTALMSDARVYTSTFDPRYPKCLGRPYTPGRSIYEPIPYLSEIGIANITSGGYLSGAVGLDGELYVWGQMCPASLGKLAVLEGPMEGSDSSRKTGVDCEGEQDEFVQCLRVRIQGREARVYHVAAGHGHVVIAAEAVKSEGDGGACTVFVAGDNSRGQLGPGIPKGFVGKFEEVVMLRNKRVIQVVAAGWSTLVVTNDGDKKEM